ncbi:MAG: hypothetical protein SPL54_01280, partial [Lachnospiraceae bacterium]|nr:hypothetical protein [Lachnospiraceae bacterium]
MEKRREKEQERVNKESETNSREAQRTAVRKLEEARSSAAGRPVSRDADVAGALENISKSLNDLAKYEKKHSFQAKMGTIGSWLLFAVFCAFFAFLTPGLFRLLNN